MHVDTSAGPTAAFGILGSLVQPHAGDETQGENASQGRATRAKQAKAIAAWDRSYESEDIDWYSEYVARHGPISVSWLQQPSSGKLGSGRRKSFYEVKGIGLLRDCTSTMENKVVAPLEDGRVCVWDLSRSHSSEIVSMSAPGLLATDISSQRRGMLAQSKASSSVDFVDAGECVSVDSIRQRAYMAVGNILNEVDIATLQVVSQQRYRWPIFALSQETDYSVPLSVATTLSLQMYDSRLSSTEEEEAVSLRCEKRPSPLVQERRLFALSESSLLRFQPDSTPHYRIRSIMPSQKSADYAPLFQPAPLSVLHPPLPCVNTILLAGHFPSILCYDRRFLPRLQNAVHSGGRLCGLTSVPSPQLPWASSSNSIYPESQMLVACGEYRGRGSLELYRLSSSSNGQESDTSDVSDMSLAPLPLVQNRQSAAKSKLLSVQSQGTRIVYSDADGNIKWVERDGRSEVRKFNINSDERTGTGATDAVQDGRDNTRPSEVARRLLPTCGEQPGGELLIWTGERIGRMRFSRARADDEDEDGDSILTDEEASEEIRNRQELEYEEMMRRLLEQQADEVRWMGRLGLA